MKRLDRIEDRLSLMDAAVAAQRKIIKQISIDGIPLKGNPAAKAVVLQYTDFDCPFCLSFARETLPEFLRTYVDSGRVLFGLRHLPLENRHPTAVRAATAAECAGRQDRFWEMHDALFAKPEAREVLDLLGLSGALGLKTDVFSACLNEGAPIRIKTDVEVARDLRVNGTPTFLFGERQSDGTVKITRLQSGVLTIRMLSSMVDDLLRAIELP